MYPFDWPLFLFSSGAASLEEKFKPKCVFLCRAGTIYNSVFRLQVLPCSGGSLKHVLSKTLLLWMLHHLGPTPVWMWICWKQHFHPSLHANNSKCTVTPRSLVQEFFRNLLLPKPQQQFHGTNVESHSPVLLKEEINTEKAFNFWEVVYSYTSQRKRKVSTLVLLRNLPSVGYLNMI